MIFYNEEQAINTTLEEPSLIFELMTEGHLEVVDKVLKTKKIDINTVDNQGNNILMRLLRMKQFDLVLKYMKNKNWDVNHQNNDGNTFAHILVTYDYLHVANIINELKKNKKLLPNIKNNNNETILDRSLSHNCLWASMKILEDKRFNSIDILSFKHLYDAYIKNSYYGKYTKLTNLEIIIKNLETKRLLPRMRELLNSIVNNMKTIRNEILNNKSNNLDTIIDSYLQVA